MNENRWQDATRHAHTLKGNAGNIGATLLQQQAADVEKACAQEQASTVKTLMSRIQPALEQVFDCINQILSNPSMSSDESVVSTGLSDDEIKEKLNYIGKGIAEFSATAGDSLVSLMEQVNDKSLSLELADIYQALESYDFETAASKLKAVLEQF
ncbi:Hpt domain-containing protein [Catenovulum sp. SM1970]|uniref:Hpt domain-containing protein n=1 Tax=Marinifaba aquimaris TaxID=2741323 RepID=UPI001572BEB0|nr:Hpt domain-containing protein [Marinifaba aquimaris]